MIPGEASGWITAGWNNAASSWSTRVIDLAYTPAMIRAPDRRHKLLLSRQESDRCSKFPSNGPRIFLAPLSVTTCETIINGPDMTPSGPMVEIAFGRSEGPSGG